MKRILSILISSILVFSLVGCNSEKKEVVNTSNNKENSQNEDNNKNEYKLGETFKAGTTDITVVNKSTTKEDKYGELEPGKELLVVTVKLENLGDKDLEFNPNYFSIQTKKGDITESDKLPKGGERLNSTTLQKGDLIEGDICFEINEGESINKITYDDFKNKVIIKL